MRQLSGLDASFLVLETNEAPMHIGAAVLLDPSTRGGGLSFDDFREFLTSRIGAIPIFRQKLREEPTGLGKPYWVDDPDFDLDRHLQRAEIPEPGGWRQLRALMEWEFSQPLDRSRPLWQIIFAEGLGAVRGLPEGCAVLISKVHHAAIDGLSGAEILAALFDLSPDAPAPPPETGWSPEAPPGTLALLSRAGRNLAAKPGEITRTVRHTLKGAVRAGAARALARVEPPPSPFTAPRCRLNAPVTGERVWDGVVLSLEGIKEIKNAAADATMEGATVNDVVLTVCSGALRRHLAELGELPEEPLVAMVPVSVRPEEARSAMGNQVTAMLVSLATDLEQPGERLAAIRHASNRSKIYQQALGAETLTDYTRFLPFSLGGLATRLYSRMHLSRYHKPIFNLVITNVPGPQVPLYMAGARMLAHIGAGPIFDGMGMILVIFSYAGSLAIGVTSCRSILPDASVFTRHLAASYGELRQDLGLSADSGAGKVLFLGDS
jgi:WS/DGAT/MGAT family acyltransferase